MLEKRCRVKYSNCKVIQYKCDSDVSALNRKFSFDGLGIICNQALPSQNFRFLTCLGNLYCYIILQIINNNYQCSHLPISYRIVTVVKSEPKFLVSIDWNEAGEFTVAFSFLRIKIKCTQTCEKSPSPWQDLPLPLF